MGKQARTYRLPDETIAAIEEIASREGISHQAVIIRAVWYLSTLEGRLSDALEAALMDKLPAMVDEKIANQNANIESILEKVLQDAIKKH